MIMIIIINSMFIITIDDINDIDISIKLQALINCLVQLQSSDMYNDT